MQSNDSSDNNINNIGLNGNRITVQSNNNNNSDNNSNNKNNRPNAETTSHVSATSKPEKNIGLTEPRPCDDQPITTTSQPLSDGQPITTPSLPPHQHSTPDTTQLHHHTNQAAVIDLDLGDTPRDLSLTYKQPPTPSQSQTITNTQSIVAPSESRGGPDTRDMPLNRPNALNRAKMWPRTTAAQPIGLSVAATRAHQAKTNQVAQANNSSMHKANICQDYANFRCKHGILGKKCSLDHPKPCEKYLTHGLNQKVGCNRGKRCRFFHPNMCRNSLKHHKCFREDCPYPHIRGTWRTNYDTRTAQTQLHQTSQGYQRWNQNAHPSPTKINESHPFLGRLEGRIKEWERMSQQSLNYILDRIEWLESRNGGWSRGYH